MAVLIEGLQGSGKSYYATYKMLHDENKYSKIFTNIDGIKTTDKIKPMQFKSFVADVLEDAYTQQVQFDGNFKESLEIFKTAGYLPNNVSKENRVLIVIDEAQNYFGKSVKLQASLVWFITQHRHLYFELYLITQKYTLLRNDYHLFNLAYKAYPPVKQILKNRIKYTEYAGLPMNTDNESRRFSLPKEQAVFDLYESGDKVDSPNILTKFIVYILIIFLVMFLAIFYFLSNFGAKKEVISKSDIPIQHVQNSRESPIHNNQEIKPPEVKVIKKLFIFSVWNDGEFTIQNIDETKLYPIEFLTYLKEEYFIQVITTKKDDFRTVIHVICNNEMKTFLSHSSSRRLKDFSTQDIMSKL